MLEGEERFQVNPSVTFQLPWAPTSAAEGEAGSSSREQQQWQSPALAVTAGAVKAPKAPANKIFQAYCEFKCGAYVCKHPLYGENITKAMTARSQHDMKANNVPRYRDIYSSSTSATATSTTTTTTTTTTSTTTRYLDMGTDDQANVGDMKFGCHRTQIGVSTYIDWFSTQVTNIPKGTKKPARNLNEGVPYCGYNSTPSWGIAKEWHSGCRRALPSKPGVTTEIGVCQQQTVMTP